MPKPDGDDHLPNCRASSPLPPCQDFYLQALFLSLDTFLIFMLVRLEIADCFSTGLTLTFQFSSNFARDMSYTLAWAVFNLGLLQLGFTDPSLAQTLFS